MHRMKYLRYGDVEPAQHAARCACGWFSGKLDQPQAVEDAVLAHEREVERVRTHLATKTPSLASQRNYYRQMAQDPNTESRDLWNMLADELDRRLNEQGKDGDVPLW